MSTSVDGYKERTKMKVDTIKLLKKPDVWLDGYGNDQDMEDARDLLSIVQRLCRVQRKWGKGKQISH
jgi:hypothetical protein